MDALQKLLDELWEYGIKKDQRVPAAVKFEVDGFAGKDSDSIGYAATIYLKETAIVGRGPSVEEALEKVREKFKHKTTPQPLCL